MKAIKPMSLGLLHKPYRFRQRNHLVIVALGFFRLGESAETLLAEQDAWPDIVKRLPAEQPLDMVMPKPRGEVLAAASAFAARPVTEMPVRLQVATVDKRLRVIGDRQWFYGTTPLHGITAPALFNVMPIDYSRAYGGAEHPGNPVGTGHTGRRFGALWGGNRGAMPNLEYPAQPVSGHHKPLPPAGFGPLDVRWAPRRDKSGTYDQRWLEEHAPGLAPDLDWSVFNAAPQDQQLQGYFEGGEAYRLEGLHPQKTVIEGRLPALRVRAFLQRQGAAAAEEVAMDFDTVWLFPDAELGVALYRGQVEVADSEAADATSLLLAYERTGDTPRTLEHYRQALSLRLGTGKEALIHLMNEAPLKPAPNAAALVRQEAEAREEEARALAQSQLQLDAAVAEMGDSMPEGFVAPKAELPPFGVLPRAALARGEADLSALFARIDARVAEVQADGEARLAALAATQQELRDVTGQDESPAAAPLDDNADAALERAHGLHHARRAALLVEVQPPADGVDGDALTARAAAQGAELDRQGRRAALQAVPLALGPAAAAALGAEVRRLLASGASLAGRDLAGAALAGIDLAGADLRGALLERADLRGANLAGANLGGAVLAGTLLEGARLDGASLDGASLNRVQARGASLRQVRGRNVTAMGACLAGADLTGAELEAFIGHGADLSDATLDDARLPGAVLLQIAAPRSRWRRAQLEQAILIRSDLGEADLAGARLVRCAFAESRAGGASFQGARLDNCFFGSADLAGARLARAVARMSSWRKGALAGVDLSGGLFEQCDFGEATLQGADLRGAGFNAAILSGARLGRCDGRDSEWFQSQCRKTDFRHADLGGARFMQADLSEALFAHARLADARHLPPRLDTDTGKTEVTA